MLQKMLDRGEKRRVADGARRKLLLTAWALSAAAAVLASACVGPPARPTPTPFVQVIRETFVLDRSPKTLYTVDIPQLSRVTVEVTVTQPAEAGVPCAVPTIWGPNGNRLAKPEATETSGTGARYEHAFHVAEAGEYSVDLHNVECDIRGVVARAEVVWRIAEG